MRYRKLLLPLSDGPCGQAALSLAIELAKGWNAHLAAVIVRADMAAVAPLAGEGLSGAMIDDMMEASERQSAIRARALETMFGAAVTASAIPACAAGSPVTGASASVITVTGRDDDLLAGLAKLSDLTILPHASQNEDPGASACLHAILFESGRPVLIAPKRQIASLGRRCCIAWNGTTESSAALAAILPWLRDAEAVRVLHAPEYQRRGPQAVEILPYLAWHGVQADCAAFQPVNRDVGAGLMAAAAAFRADLLGMGAYSHSRLRQMILGGITRHVLGHAELPVLMAH